jgi:hypothetical protein
MCSRAKDYLKKAIDNLAAHGFNVLETEKSGGGTFG